MSFGTNELEIIKNTAIKLHHKLCEAGSSCDMQCPTSDDLAYFAGVVTIQSLKAYIESIKEDTQVALDDINDEMAELEAEFNPSFQKASRPS